MPGGGSGNPLSDMQTDVQAMYGKDKYAVLDGYKVVRGTGDIVTVAGSTFVTFLPVKPAKRLRLDISEANLRPVRSVALAALHYHVVRGLHIIKRRYL